MTTYIPSLTLPSAIFENAAISILFPIVAGTAVGFSTQPVGPQQQYAALKQPECHNLTQCSPGRPPGWVFGPAWTLLYGLMGYAAHRAWTVGTTSANPNTVALARHGATLYSIQLGLNLIWMPLFFRFGRPIEATADVVALTGLTGWLIYVWGQVDETAGYALVPYLGWLTFASYLSAGCGYLNNWDFTGKTAKRS
ncbi:hypothetical protein MBLNU13_g00341t1 [Cladosporium sp. NU13]